MTQRKVLISGFNQTEDCLCVETYDNVTEHVFFELPKEDKKNIVDGVVVQNKITKEGNIDFEVANKVFDKLFEENCIAYPFVVLECVKTDIQHAYMSSKITSGISKEELEFGRKRLLIFDPGGPQDIRVRVEAVGICGSDVHYLKSMRCADFVVKEPMVICHECDRVIEEVGSDVKNPVSGDRVALEPGIFCWRCDLCKEGRCNLYLQMKFFATPPVHGSLANQVVHLIDLCFKLLNNVSLEEGAMCEPLSICAYRRAHIGPKTYALIMGAGPISHVTMLAACAFGVLRIVVVDIDDHRLSITKELDADAVVKVSAIIQVVNAEVGQIHKSMGTGVNVNFDCVGFNKTMSTKLGATRACGKVCLVGLSHRFGFSQKEVEEAFETCAQGGSAIKVMFSLLLSSSFFMPINMYVQVQFISKGIHNHWNLVVSSFDEIIEDLVLTREKSLFTVGIHLQNKLEFILMNCALEVLLWIIVVGIGVRALSKHSDAIDLLPRLTTRIDVNIKFRRIDDFEFRREYAVFDLLAITLSHGWIVDPDDNDIDHAIGLKSYNTLMGDLVELDTQNVLKLSEVAFPTPSEDIFAFPTSSEDIFAGSNYEQTMSNNAIESAYLKKSEPVVPMETSEGNMVGEIQKSCQPELSISDGNNDLANYNTDLITFETIPRKDVCLSSKLVQKIPTSQSSCEESGECVVYKDVVKKIDIDALVLHEAAVFDSRGSAPLSSSTSNIHNSKRVEHVQEQSMLKPDVKTQVTIEYQNDSGVMVPIREHIILISIQINETITNGKPVVLKDYLYETTIFHLNSAGCLIVGALSLVLCYCPPINPTLEGKGVFEEQGM